MSRFERWAPPLTWLALTCAVAPAHSAPAAGPGGAAPVGLVSAQPRRFAVVVGENTPRSETLGTLKYADDDAIRHAELLRALGVTVWVLTVPDAETQGLHPRIAGLAGAPTLTRLREVLTQVYAEVAQARREGASTDFFFVFAGHGEVGPNREGRLHLRDGFLSRQQLLDEVVVGNPADFKHLVLDACHAEALVYRRGEGETAPDFSDLIAGDLARADLTHHADTGILLASTRDERTHEWAVFRAGVFSHELRSGLAGAADVNRDGVIEYSELAAFVASANAGLQHTTARATVVSRPPPLDRHRALANVGEGAARLLELPGNLRGRLWIENAAGERYVDLHPSGEAPLVLAMAEPASGERYYLRRGEQEADLPMTGPGRFRLGHIDWRPARQAARGSVEDALRRNLFTVPFGPSFYDGYVASTGELRAVMQRDEALASLPLADAGALSAAGALAESGALAEDRVLGRGPGPSRRDRPRARPGCARGHRRGTARRPVDRARRPGPDRPRGGGRGLGPGAHGPARHRRLPRPGASHRPRRRRRAGRHRPPAGLEHRPDHRGRGAGGGGDRQPLRGLGWPRGGRRPHPRRRSGRRKLAVVSAMHLFKCLIGLVFLTSAGCGVEPEAVLDEADLALTLEGIAAGAVRLDVWVRRGGSEVVLRQPEVADDLLTLYLFDLPEGTLDVQVAAVGGTGGVVQCARFNLQHAGERQVLAVDLDQSAEPCPTTDDDDDDDDRPDDHPEDH